VQLHDDELEMKVLELAKLTNMLEAQGRLHWSRMGVERLTPLRAWRLSEQNCAVTKHNMNN